MTFYLRPKKKMGDDDQKEKKKCSGEEHTLHTHTHTFIFKEFTQKRMRDGLCVDDVEAAPLPSAVFAVGRRR